jgi:hypothetical protein
MNHFSCQITDSSSYNTLSGNEGSTDDFIGLLFADPLPGTATLAKYGASHNNSITNNQTWDPSAPIWAGRRRFPITARRLPSKPIYPRSIAM